MSRPRVVAYLDSTEIGGAEKCLRSVVEGLDGSFAYTVAGNDANVVEWVAGSARAEQLVLPDAPTKTSFRPGWAHVRAFRRLRPDIVHVSLRHPYACQWGTVAGLLAPGAGVFAVEQLPIPPANRMQARIKRLLASRLDAHVAVGAAAARDLEGWVALQPGSVGTLYNARPSDPVTRSTPSNGVPRCVAVGRLDVQKGFDLLIDALTVVDEVELRIVGEGAERASLEAQAAAAGVAERVHFVGWVDDPRPELARADMFVLPSRFEALPLSIIEAMFAELPVIAADVGSVGELVADGETGVLVPANDSAAVAAAIRQLAGDRRRQRELGSAGRARALERFSLEAMLEHYRALYQELLA